MSSLPPLPAVHHRPAVRRAGPDDLAGAAAALAGAYQDDPLVSWCVPHAGRRRVILPSFFRIVADALAADDETFVAGLTGRPVAGVIDAAAMWAPPGPSARAAAGAPQLATRMADLLGADAGRTFETVALLTEHRPGPAHRDLWFLGVAPGAQGRGLGTALLGLALAEADRAGEPVSVRATSKDSRRLYERHGFEVVDELAVPGGPVVWPMSRHPR